MLPPLRSHSWIATVAILAALAVPQSRAEAQQSDPVEDLIRSVVNDVNDLRYAQAIRGGREILAAAASLRPTQEVTLRFALAAAYYPESEGEQSPDSALAQLVRVVRVAPDADMPVVLAWPGLDSLFSLARTRTLSVVLRPARDSFVVTATGAPASTIPAVASRPVRFRLSTRRVGGAEVTHMASSTPSARTELALRTAEGDRVLLERGEYELIVTATDSERGDSAQSVRRIQVEGMAPVLLPLPQLDSARLRPEQRKPQPWRIAAAGGAMALATFVIAEGMRARGPIASASAADPRAGLIGLSIIGATGWAIWRDREGSDLDAIEANTAARALHERSFSAATAENNRRLAAHRVTVKFLGEGR